MLKTIFEYSDYKIYLNLKIESLPSKGRGIKLKMAEFLNCQNTYISQVIKGDVHFSFEQGIKLNQFFEHTKEEGKYFLNLIHLARANSDELKKYYRDEINEIILKNSDIKKRTNIKGSLKEKDQEVYYSSWLYSAIHILVTIKEFRSVQMLSKRLNISKNKTIEILDFLESTGLLAREGNLYSTGLSRIHLSKDSTHIQKHHTNWRVRAINSIDLNLENDLHFSNVVSMGENDVVKVREIFIKAIADARAIIKDSPEEKLHSICVDFFEV